MKRRGLGTVLVGFGTTLPLVLWGNRIWQSLVHPLCFMANDVKHTWLGGLAWDVLHSVAHALLDCVAPGMAVASLAMLVTVVAHGVAAARLRGGRADPLDRLRARPGLVRALTLLPAVLFAFPWLAEALVSVQFFREGAGDGLGWWIDRWITYAVTGGVTGTLAYVASRAWMRGLLAPVVTEESAPRDPGDIVFSAVAVTARTRGAVAALAAASLVMVAWTLAPHSATSVYEAAFPWALAAYIAAAMSAPFALRRVSRIAVGLDGVWVRDASQALFFAYRDLEGARARGGDLELVAKDGRAALRLQMHGDDAGRRDEVLARIEDAIARSRSGDTRGAATLVQAMPTRQIVASAAGDARYRMPSISREQLWDLVESPATDASTRTAAAQALAAQTDEHDRARLRVAAEQCAEPRVRIALAALAVDDDANDDELPAAERSEAGQPNHRLG